MRQRRGWIPALVLLVTVAGHANSETKETEAAKHFEKALAHVDRKEFDLAVAEFQKAYDSFPNHSIYYNIGLAQLNAGKPSRAVRAFERYLEEGSAEIPLERRERVAELIRSAREKLGRLQVNGVPANATLKVDGEVVKPDPAGLELDAGPHELAVTAPGYLARTWSVTVKPREVVTVDASLASRPARPLWVRCPVPDVSVELDGRPLAVMHGDAEVLLHDVPADAQSLAFKRAGYQDHVITIASLEGRGPAVCALMPYPAAKTARLDLQIAAPGAQVSIDGAPYEGGALVPGRHTLVVRHPDFEPFSRSIVLHSRKPLPLSVVLFPTLARRAEYERRARAQRTQAYAIGAAGLAVGAAALGIGIYADHRYADWHARQSRLPPVGAPATDEQRRAQADNDELEGTIRTLDRVALGMAISSALAMGGAVWWYLSGDDPQRYRQRSGSAVGVAGSTLTFRSSF